MTAKDSTDIHEWHQFIETSHLYEKKYFPACLEEGISYICRQIEIYCPQCKKMRFFDSQANVPGMRPFNSRPFFPEQRVITLEFSCKNDDCNCKKYYLFHCQRVDDRLILTKAGEWPSESPRISKAIEETFPDSADLLKKGVVCLKEGYGVGAFAYFRQVLERHIEALLDTIESYAKDVGDSQTMEQIAKLRGGSPMSNKIALAKDVLPAILIVDGINPLGTIYGSLSEDIHKGTDEECLQKAQEIYDSLSFILSSLAQFQKSRNEYAESLKRLHEKKENESCRQKLK